MLYPKPALRKDPSYTFGIWAPPADKATLQCAAAFRKDTAFAMLIPSDIVRFIPVDVEGKYNHLVAKRLRQAGKISFLDVGLVWIIHRVPKVCQVYDAVSYTHLTLPTICSV